MKHMKSVLFAALAFAIVFGAIAFPSAAQAKAKNCQTIAEIAAGDPNFSTLVAALSAAGLVDTLNGKGKFTVFAPTNDAFAKLPEGTVENLLGDIPALTNVLLYHVARGERMAVSVVNASQLRMLNKQFAPVSEMDGSYYIANAKIVATDIKACNGVIHVIEDVMLP